MDYIKRITQLMDSRGLSQYALGKAAGVSQGVISDLLSGRNKTPSLRTVEKFCQVFNISLSDFFAEDAPTPPPTEAELLTAFRALPDDKQQQAVRLVKAL